jgi:hypothetical protein
VLWTRGSYAVALIEIAARRQRSRNVQVRHARAHSAPHRRSNDSQNGAVVVKRIKVAGAADEDVTGDVTPGRHGNAPRRPHRSHISNNVHGRRGLCCWKTGKGSTSSAFPPGKHSGFATC